MTETKKKRNPADATGRNVRAGHKVDARQSAMIEALETFVKELTARMVLAEHAIMRLEDQQKNPLHLKE